MSCVEELEEKVLQDTDSWMNSLTNSPALSGWSGIFHQRIYKPFRSGQGRGYTLCAVQKMAADVRERAVALQQSRLVAPSNSKLPLGHSGWCLPMSRMNLRGFQRRWSAVLTSTREEAMCLHQLPKHSSLCDPEIWQFLGGSIIVGLSSLFLEW